VECEAGEMCERSHSTSPVLWWRPPSSHCSAQENFQNLGCTLTKSVLYFITWKKQNCFPWILSQSLLRTLFTCPTIGRNSLRALLACPTMETGSLRAIFACPTIRSGSQLALFACPTIRRGSKVQTAWKRFNQLSSTVYISKLSSSCTSHKHHHRFSCNASVLVGSCVPFHIQNSLDDK
jgi:hypothetical protein